VVSKKKKDFLFISVILLLCSQWIFLSFSGVFLPPPWNCISPGIAIFAAAFMLSWGAELAQFEIPQSLAIAFLALVAVLPEYAVDMYFAWHAGKNPEYIHYASANMTGANRLLIGLGWAAVGLTYFFKSKKKEIQLDPGNRVELFALLAATLYCFVIPLKHNLSWVDSLILISILVWYMIQATRSHHIEPEIEGPIQAMAKWSRGKRLLITFFFFLFSGFTILVAAQPFAEGLLSTGAALGIEKFVLVQWLAPLASESPEFIVAILFALRLRAKTGLGTLISSTVNQWTLLIGMLPLVYNLSLGHLTPMPLDARQSEEIFLTVSQSIFAILIIANLKFSLLEASLVGILFVTQLFFTSTESRILYSELYLALAAGWFLFVKSNRQGFGKMLRDGFRHPKNIK